MVKDLLWLIPLLPALGFVVLGLAGARLPKRVVSFIACGTVLASLVLSVMCFFELQSMPPNHRHHMNLVAQWIGPLELDWAFVLDPLSSLMLLIVTGVGFLIHVYSIGYMWEETGYARYFAYLNLFMAMMLVLVLGSSLPVLFVGWEGVGLCSYLLIGYYYTKVDCADAGRKAFIVNRIGDTSFVLGMLLAWRTLGGSFDIATMLQAAPTVALDSPLTITAIALLLFGGACGKSAQIPLFIWLPDAMAGPTPVSALIHAATMVTAGVYMVCRMAPLFVLAPNAMVVIAIVGAATALIAGLIGLGQNDIKKVLAYSTISQLGYMFMAAGVGAFGAAMFHVTTHAFFKALMFLASGAVIHALHGEQDMTKMGGLRKFLPRTSLCFMAGWVAIAGVPLTAGFFSKDEILYKTFQQNPALWAIGVICAALTALYMTRLMALTFFTPSRMSHETEHHIHEAPPSMMVPLVILAILSLVGGFIGMPASWFGHSPFESWLAPVFEGPEMVMAVHGAEGHGLEFLLMGISSLIALGGLGVGWYLWVTKPDLPGAIAARASAVYDLIKGKFYVDEFYELIFLKPYYWLCRTMALFDEKVVDGAVNGSGGAMEISGNVLKLFHSGFVRNYALIYLVGATVIFWYLLF